MKLTIGGSKMERQELQKELAAWIDPMVLAEAILEHLAENDEIEVSLENAKTVWLDYLYTELHPGLRASAKAIYQ